MSSMQPNNTHVNDCQDSIIGIWICLDLEVTALITLYAVYGSPRRGVCTVFVSHMQPQRRKPLFTLLHTASALRLISQSLFYCGLFIH